MESAATTQAGPSGRQVLALGDLGSDDVAVAGGKGSSLGELSRIDGVVVPDGFCVTTAAFRRVVSADPRVSALITRLGDTDEATATLRAELRRAIEETPVPEDLTAAIVGALEDLGAGEIDAAYAVRSSATAEDLPTASFAGQQDTFLNVVGPAAIVEHVRRCWASLFSDRAVAYRTSHEIDHRMVAMAVVVQRQVLPDASGVLFTADPVSGDRRVVAVEATFGLGEALVSGLVDADAYEVRDGRVVSRSIASKQIVIEASPSGGTVRGTIDPSRRSEPTLTDDQVLRLARLGRRIAAHFGAPQDVEWCIVDDEIRVVQSRPITTLFPVPETDDDANHVYVSVGHQQMMTDAMRPLGLSVWLLTTPRPMVVAGGRLFVDVTDLLATPATRAGLLELGRSDPLIKDALETVIARDDYVPTRPDAPTIAPPPGGPPSTIATDPGIVADLMDRTYASLAALGRQIDGKVGVELIDVILGDFDELRRVLFHPQSQQVVMAAIESTHWLNDRLFEWLGETSAADALTQSAPGNVTSEMGLALLDVADVVRAHPDVIAFLRNGVDDDFLEALDDVPGGDDARAAIETFLERYGMRCVGEIDITRPRWSEQPTALVPVILANVDNFEPGAAARRFERGRSQAAAQERSVLERLRRLPDGDRKADETAQMIQRLRACIGYREFPKYGMVSRYAVYKQAILEEAGRLVDDGVLGDVEDCFFLSLPELRDVVRTRRVDEALVARRRQDFEVFRTLTPPRVMTSDGEAITGTYRRDDLPDGALVGLAVSAGTVEGRARVVDDLAGAALQPGDILVTAYTDPSWTPVFVTIAGLVTEVGGLMTHGAVVAREYGLPAVVGVVGATASIADGQWIRVDGTAGTVSAVDAPA